MPLYILRTNGSLPKWMMEEELIWAFNMDINKEKRHMVKKSENGIKFRYKATSLTQAWWANSLLSVLQQSPKVKLTMCQRISSFTSRACVTSCACGDKFCSKFMCEWKVFNEWSTILTKGLWRYCTFHIYVISKNILFHVIFYSFLPTSAFHFLILVLLSASFNCHLPLRLSITILDVCSAMLLLSSCLC